MKENLAKLKEAEKKLRENPSVKENLAKLREAEERFKDNPAVKERLSNLKDAEKKFREEAKDKQVCARAVARSDRRWCTLLLRCIRVAAAAFSL